MGVSGLTGFLRENRNSVTHSVHLKPLADDELDHPPVAFPLVVDGWSFIWCLYGTHLPSFSGGDYLGFRRLVQRVITGWHRVGIRPHFVFDGHAPPSKHLQVISRLERLLKTSLLFYRTSVQSRSSPSFLASTPILPPFLFHVLRDTLEESAIPAYYLAEGEADGYCASLAIELGGGVLSSDSDFAIFGNGSTSDGGEGFRGWIPIDELQWLVEEPSQSEAGDMNHFAGFSSVKSRRGKGRRTNSAYTATLLPPPPFQHPNSTAVSHPTLVITVIHPDDLATRLRIPSTHLPLLASIAGSDHSPAGASQLFFDNKANGPDRIEKVARAIRDALSPVGQEKIRRQLRDVAIKSSKTGSSRTSSASDGFTPSNSGQERQHPPVAGDQAYAFVSYVITLMLQPVHPLQRHHRSKLQPDAFDNLVSGIIDATCHYIPPISPAQLRYTSCCDTYPYCRCDRMASTPADEAVGHPMDAPSREVRRQYARARAKGRLSHFSSYQDPATTYLSIILEDPEGSGLRASNASRALRRKAWSTFLSSVGGLKPPITDNSGGQEAAAENLGDHEMQTDNAAADSNTAASELTSDSSLALEGAAMQLDREPIDVVEYLRVGSSTRLRGVPLELNTPKQDGPIYLGQASFDDRVAAFYTTLISDNSKSAALPPTLRPFVAVLRMSIIRAQESGSPWTSKDLALSVHSGLASMHLWQTDQVPTEQDTSTTGGDLSEEVLELVTKHCNTLSQVIAATLDATQLAQCLLLDGGGNDDGQISGISRLYRFLDGETWHKNMLEDTYPASSQEDAAACMSAVAEGMESFIIGWDNNNVKPAKSRSKAGARVGGGAPRDNANKNLPENWRPRNNSRFDVLLES